MKPSTTFFWCYITPGCLVVCGQSTPSNCRGLVLYYNHVKLLQHSFGVTSPQDASWSVDNPPRATVAVRCAFTNLFPTHPLRNIVTHIFCYNIYLQYFFTFCVTSYIKLNFAITFHNELTVYNSRNKLSYILTIFAL